MGWFSEQGSEKNHSNTKHERFLTSSMYTRKDRVLYRFTIFKKNSSVVEPPAAVREVPGSNPGVPKILISRKLSKAFTWAIVEEESKINLVTENRSWLPSSKIVCVQGQCALEFDNHRQHS